MVLSAALAFIDCGLTYELLNDLAMAVVSLEKPALRELKLVQNHALTQQSVPVVVRLANSVGLQTCDLTENSQLFETKNVDHFPPLTNTMHGGSLPDLFSDMPVGGFGQVIDTNQIKWAIVYCDEQHLQQNQYQQGLGIIKVSGNNNSSIGTPPGGCTLESQQECFHPMAWARIAVCFKHLLSRTPHISAINLHGFEILLHEQQQQSDAGDSQLLVLDDCNLNGFLTMDLSLSTYKGSTHQGSFQALASMLECCQHLHSLKMDRIAGLAGKVMEENPIQLFSEALLRHPNLQHLSMFGDKFKDIAQMYHLLKMFGNMQHIRSLHLGALRGPYSKEDWETMAIQISSSDKPM